MSQRGRFAALVGAVLIVSACAGSPGSSTTASHDPAEVSATVARFVSALQQGDGVTACATLRDDEKQLFVSNASTIPGFAAAATSCEDVVAAFPAVAGARAKELDGRFAGVSVADDIASGSWVWATGDQRALLMHGDAGWQFMYNANDFPSALLHIGD